MAEKKREVLEEMFKGLERTSFASDRLLKQYRNSRQRMEGQSESASPESDAVQQMEERIEAVPRDGIYVARKVNTIHRKMSRKKEKWNEQRKTTAKQSGHRQGMPAGEKAGYTENVQKAGSTVQQRGRASADIKTISVQRMMKQKQTYTVGKVQRHGVGRFKNVFSGLVKGVSKAVTSNTAVIAAGAAAVVMVVMLVCMVGMVCGSTYGIFFTGQKTDSKSQTMQDVIYALAQDYDLKLSGLIESKPHDEVVVYGARPEWKEVISVYAVKTNLDTTDAQEIASMNKKKAKILEDIFWDMVSLNVVISEKVVTETVVSTAESGSTGVEGTEVESTKVESIEVETTEVKSVQLTVYIDSKTAQEMTEIYGFSDEQKAYLTELLDARNDSLWKEVIP